MKKLRRFLAIVPAIAAMAAIAGCTAVNTAPDPAGAKTTLSVDNGSYVDMTIYVLRGFERVRLGMASAAAKSQFVIPPDIARTVIALRFIADPIGSSRVSVSEEITVHPGDIVEMQIPPN